jgi:hypothetical protein
MCATFIASNRWHQFSSVATLRTGIRLPALGGCYANVDPTGCAVPIDKVLASYGRHLSERRKLMGAALNDSEYFG